MFILVVLIIAVLAIIFSTNVSKYNKFELRKDQVGNTIQSFNNKTAEECQKECDKLQNCRGFVSYSDNRCFLKSSIDNMIDKDGSVIFIK